jgi:hypothetical protein
MQPSALELHYSIIGSIYQRLRQLTEAQAPGTRGAIRVHRNAADRMADGRHNPAATSIAVSTSVLYHTHGDGTIWIYTGPPISGWQMLD